MYKSTKVGLIAFGLMSLAACGGAGPESTNDANLASAEIGLSMVPSGVQCVKVVVTVGTQTITPPLMTVASGASSATLSIGQLPAGSAVFAGSAYNVACASVTSSTAASWLADSASSVLSAGTLTTVQMTFRPNNAVAVNANFVGNVAEIAVGQSATYARLSDGTVLQWGAFGSGQSVSPTPVPGLTNVTQISAGATSACARKSDGTVWCWGLNGSGQLGPNAALGGTVVTPVQVPFGGSMISVAVGFTHACAVASTAAIYCWGDNSLLQLGVSSPAMSATPVFVASGSMVAAGYGHTCALDSNSGQAFCWGNNTYGQLGDGTTTSRSFYQYLPTPDLVGMSLGYFHTCATRADGSVRCWGYNGYGQLGDGTFTNHLTPTLVPGITDGAQVQVSGYTTCLRRTGGTVSCWGYGGALGDNIGDGHATPGPVFGLTNAIAIHGSSGASHFCAEGSDHSIKCWGANYYGQIGDGTITFAPKPVDVKF